MYEYMQIALLEDKFWIVSGKISMLFMLKTCPLRGSKVWDDRHWKFK